MRRPRIFIALGSNMNRPAGQVRTALTALAASPSVGLTACSPLYQTPPWGVTDQPPFVNAVAEIATSLSPTGLLDTLLGLEHQAGRVRHEQWGPRTIDLDLLTYGQCVYRTRHLTLPHPGIVERAFVLVPWAEIAADFAPPGLACVAQLLAKCPGVDAIQRLADPPDQTVEAAGIGADSRSCK